MKKSPIVLLSLILLLSYAGSSSAVSLGRHRGAALIGRPLDLTVQAVLDAQEDLAALCLEADVFYADNRQEKSRVRVTAEKATPAAQDALIRIRSSTLIDEPVVTVYVRIGCQQKVERRYVVLADLASEVAGQAALPQVPTTSESRPVAVPAVAAGQRATSSRPAVAARSGPGSNRIADPSTPGVAGAPVRQGARTSALAPKAALVDASQGVAGTAPQTKAGNGLKESKTLAQRREPRGKTAEKGSARLKLEALDLTIERDPSLKSSAELLSTPSAGAQERSAAAALWRALTAQPQDILRDLEKLQALENSVRALQIQTQKNQVTIAELALQLKKAESERYANALVYLLVALLLAAVATMVYLLRRRSGLAGDGADELPWWRKNEPRERGWANSALGADVSSPSDLEIQKKKISRKEKGTRVTAPTALDLDLDLGLNESGFTDVKHMSSLGPDSMPPLSRADRSEFGLSLPSSARAVKAEELFDVQQQADFFVSIGQHEQAIEVLRNHIGDNVETSALVYLDLFNLYHQLKRQADYDALREEFNQRFNGKIPAFDFYNESSAGLESYQVALSRIEALWPSPKVLEIIEESIFRRPDESAEAFDLEAYRELLLLYSVAREIISPEKPARHDMLKFDLPDSGTGSDFHSPPKFLATSIQPLLAVVVPPRKEPEGQPFLVSTLPPSLPQLGLDLDLSQFGNENSEAISGADSDSRFFAQFAADIAVSPPKPPAQPAAKLPSLPVATPRAPATGNLIDFDAFDSSGNDINPSKLPKS